MTNDDDEARARMAQLAALGQVAAGVTHEVRNVMTGVLGFTQVAKKRAETEPENVGELLGMIEKESQRCLEILTNFLRFTRPRRHDLQPVALRDVVDGACRLMAHPLGLRHMKLEVSIGDAPLVLGDRAALEQVVLNLMLNAMQAQDDGGTVRVSLSRSGTGAEIRVADDGPGVPEDVAARLFQPFFTTKGDGTGMGLHVSRDVAVEHGGTLTLERGEGRGAVFALKLPGIVE
jgi:signal transduction histidine kinase